MDTFKSYEIPVFKITTYQQQVGCPVVNDNVRLENVKVKSWSQKAP